jgi:titin
MLVLRKYALAGSLVLLSALACDRRQPVEPVVQAASSGAAGPAVKAPSNTSAVAVSESRIDVSWQDNSSNETGFEVHRSTSGASGAFALLASKGAGVASHGDVGLAPSTQYCYKVRAFRTTGGQTGYSEFSTAACATTLAPPIPAAPSGADARPASSSAVAVSWIDRSTNETGFRVERSLDLGATWTSTRTTGANAISSSDEALASEQPVCYRVIAFNARGDSPPSNSDCTTPPAAPTGLTATAAEGPAIDLVWTDNSAVEDGYEILRATDGAAFGIVTDVPPNSTTYHDAGATTNATYSYQLRAKKDGGHSDLSGTASAVGSCVPASVTEICDNGVDDDCNGLADGADPACSLSCSNGCPPGYVCGVWADICVPHCGDGFLDGDEGDVDCGGSCAAKCAAGRHCWVSADCASFSCANGICL